MSLFVPFVDIPVGLDNLFPRIRSVNNLFNFPASTRSLRITKFSIAS